MAVCGRGPPLTHARSPRQLPTNVDHVGGSSARSTDISVINRRYRALGRCFLQSTGPPGQMVEKTQEKTLNGPYISTAWSIPSFKKSG